MIVSGFIWLGSFVRRNLFNFFLIFLVFAYYLQFLDKGLILYDPGYYLYNAERIINGLTPYKDFFIQFPPGYFYILASAFEVFGVSVLTGRYLTLAICLGIVFLTLKILDHLEVNSKIIKILAVLSLSAFGFPLINSPAMLAWVSVFVSLLIIYSYLKVSTGTNVKKWLILLGIFLSFIFLLKQNLAIYFFVAINLLLYKSLKGAFGSKIKKVIFVDLIVFFITLSWSFYFFIINDLGYLTELIIFSRRYLDIYPFTYPFLQVLFTDYGLLKLVPYYLPIIFAIIVGYYVFSSKKKTKWGLVGLSVIPIIGFAGTVYPTSDLLHVYPFFGVILVAILVFFYKQKYYYFWVGAVVLSILIGFYLTNFREYYRYHLPYEHQDTQVNIPRANGIHVDKNLAKSLEEVYIFLDKDTKRDDTVLMYPFCEMLYFIFDRESPSKYTIYLPGYRSKVEELGIIEEMKKKKTKYIVTCDEYRINTILSEYVQKQKKVLDSGRLKVFSIN